MKINRENLKNIKIKNYDTVIIIILIIAIIGQIVYMNKNNTKEEKTEKNNFNQMSIIEQNSVNKNEKQQNDTNINENIEQNSIANNENLKQDNTYNNENTEGKTNENKSENKSQKTDSKFYVVSLRFMNEDDAVMLLKEKNVNYNIKYAEKIGENDRSVYEYEVRDKNGDKVDGAVYANATDTVTIYVCKYENKCVKFDIDILSLAAEYLEICKMESITPKTNNYKFDLMINGKEYASETISPDLIKNIMNTDKDLTEFDYDKGFYLKDEMREGKQTKLKIKDYNGYGIFNIELKVNGVSLRKAKVDLYHMNNETESLHENIGEYLECRYNGEQREILMYGYFRNGGSG